MALTTPIPVAFTDVFPLGAFALSLEAVRDFDKSTRDKTVQARDKATGELVWVVEVLDGDTTSHQKTVKVKIMAPVAPVLPDPIAGMPLRPVEFEGMAVTPYVDSKTNRLAYSLRASGLRAPGARQATPAGKAA